MINQKGQNNLIAVIVMIVVGVATVVILYGVATGQIFTAQSSIGSITKGVSGNVATCVVESASASNNTIAIRLTNEVSNVTIDGVIVGDGGGTFSCDGPDLTYGDVSEITSVECAGLDFNTNAPLTITGTNNLWCTATAR